jgi:hypothetical protein
MLSRRADAFFGLYGYGSIDSFLQPSDPYADEKSPGLSVSP